MESVNFHMYLIYFRHNDTFFACFPINSNIFLGEKLFKQFILCYCHNYDLVKDPKHIN